MKRLVGRMKKAAAVSMAALLVLPMSASADVTTSEQLLDELEEIIEAQNEQIPQALLDETLGIAELEEAMEDAGYSIQGELGIKEESLALMELEDTLNAGNYAKFGVKHDPAGERWQLDLGLGMAQDSSLLDLVLYGDNQKLLLEIPQFYEGGVMLQSGNLAEQYKGSTLEQMLGALPQELDIDLDFYLDLDDLMESLGYNDSMERKSEDLVDDLEDSLTVTKNEADGQTVYAVTAPKEAVLTLYRELLSQYADLLEMTGAVTVNGTDDIHAEFDEIVDVLDLAIQDDIVLNYVVAGNRVTELNVDMVIDMNRVENLDRELMADMDGAVQETEAADASKNVVNMSCRVLYGASADPVDGMQILVDLTDMAGTEHVAVAITCDKETTATAETSIMHMQVKDGDEIIYDDDMLIESFDAATGAYNMRMQIRDEGNSDDNVAFVLDSTYENIVRGQSFDMVVNSLSVDADIDGVYESMGLTGMISVSADPGEFTCPKLQRDLLGMTQEEFVQLVTEIQVKVMGWAQQFAPETEASIASEPEQPVPEQSVPEQPVPDAPAADEAALETEAVVLDEPTAETESETLAVMTEVSEG